MLSTLLRRRSGGFSLPYSIDFSVLGDGALPSPLSGDTWAVSSGEAVNTPTMGSELLTNGTLETWSSSTNIGSPWDRIKSGTSSLNQESSVVHGGNYSARFDIDGANEGVTIQQGVTLAAGNFMRFIWWTRSSAAGVTSRMAISGVGTLLTSDPGETWTEQQWVFRHTAANPIPQWQRADATSASLYFDDHSVKSYLMSEMAFYTPATAADVTVKAGIKCVVGGNGGVIVNVDDPADPQNYVVGYIYRTSANATKFYIVKYVAGVATVVMDQALAASSYVENALVEIRKTDSETYQGWYNGSQAGGDQTISEAGIISNGYHGAFATDGGGAVASFFALES